MGATKVLTRRFIAKLYITDPDCVHKWVQNTGGFVTPEGEYLWSSEFYGMWFYCEHCESLKQTSSTSKNPLFP